MKNYRSLYGLALGLTNVALAYPVSADAGLNNPSHDVGTIFEAIGVQQPSKHCPHAYVDPDCNPYGLDPQEDATVNAAESCTFRFAARISEWHNLGPDRVSATFICAFRY